MAQAKAKIIYVSTDGSRWDDENKAIARDNLDAGVSAIEATIPKPPNSPYVRVAVDPAAFKAAKVAVVELCRAMYPNEPVFQHDHMEIHTASYAGRFLSEVGGPLNRVWMRFMCHHDGWMYEQPYFAANPHEFKGKESA